MSVEDGLVTGTGTWVRLSCMSGWTRNWDKKKVAPKLRGEGGLATLTKNGSGLDVGDGLATDTKRVGLPLPPVAYRGWTCH